MSELHATPSAFPARSGGRCVALVDDDPHIVAALSTWLHSIGVEPRGFDSAEALLQAMQAPDSPLRAQLAGAILDINLPAMHGLELAQRLCTDLPGLPIVVITALGPEEMARVGHMPQHAVCLRKPFDIDALEDVLFGWIH